MTSTAHLSLQEVPREELEADDADKVISVFHFSKEVSRTHGVPFRFVVKPVSCFCAMIDKVLMITPATRTNVLPIPRSVSRREWPFQTRTLPSTALH